MRVRGEDHPVWQQLLLNDTNELQMNAGSERQRSHMLFLRQYGINCGQCVALQIRPWSQNVNMASTMIDWPANFGSWHTWSVYVRDGSFCCTPESKPKQPDKRIIRRGRSTYPVGCATANNGVNGPSSANTPMIPFRDCLRAEIVGPRSAFIYPRTSAKVFDNRSIDSSTPALLAPVATGRIKLPERTDAQ